MIKRIVSIKIINITRILPKGFMKRGLEVTFDWLIDKNDKYLSKWDNVKVISGFFIEK